MNHGGKEREVEGGEPWQSQLGLPSPPLSQLCDGCVRESEAGGRSPGRRGRRRRRWSLSETSERRGRRGIEGWVLLDRLDVMYTSNKEGIAISIKKIF